MFPPSPPINCNAMFVLCVACWIKLTFMPSPNKEVCGTLENTITALTVYHPTRSVAWNFPHLELPDIGDSLFKSWHHVSFRWAFSLRYTNVMAWEESENRMKYDWCFPFSRSFSAEWFIDGKRINTIEIWEKSFLCLWENLWWMKANVMCDIKHELTLHNAKQKKKTPRNM